MSEENVEVVRRIYDSIPGPPDPIRKFFDPDYEMDLRDSQVVVDIGVVRGFEAADRAIRQYYETFEDFHIEIEELIHADEEHVVIAARDAGHVRGSDSEVGERFFHVWTFRDGKVIRFSGHSDRSGALEAAGLEE